MTGKKRMRRLALTGALLMLCTNTAAGCRQQEKQEVTPEVLMDAVDKNMKEVNSASSSLEIEVELEDVLDHTRIRMDMDMENTVSPRAGHAKGRAEVKLNDNLVSSNMEIYQVEEGDKYVTYSSLYEQWSRTESENSSSSSGTETDFFQSARAEIEDFTLAKQPVKVREKTCYEIYGDMQGKKLMDFLGEEMIQAYGLVDLPDQDARDIAPFRDLEDLTDYGVQFRYDAPFDLEPLDRASLIARVQELHRLVKRRLASAESL